MNFKNFYDISIINERKSLDLKEKFAEEQYIILRDLLINSNINIVNHFNCPFGTFTGLTIYTNKEQQLNNKGIIYYLGDSSSRGLGEIKFENNKYHIYIKTDLSDYDLFYFISDLFPDNSITSLNDISLDLFKKHKLPLIQIKPIPTREDIIFSISNNKTTIIHELIHLYDLIKHGMKDYNINKKWHLRHGELEAELVTLFSTIKNNLHNYSSKEEFEKMYPLSHSGLKNMIYSNFNDSQLLYIISQYTKLNDNKMIDKIYKRLVEIRQKIINLLK